MGAINNFDVRRPDWLNPEWDQLLLLLLLLLLPDEHNRGSSPLCNRRRHPPTELAAIPRQPLGRRDEEDVSEDGASRQ